ncbi:hypothetical protein CDL12_04635 [Handroanthus impetiginosus]|uniref:Uncharacterized protein n=1 Tax=Handroanthus impetiginosus TaxID=429701 RepID=A0A2G9HYQ9_9LAMI|nr:hypothetical protein CDL12_04635 [Handroanthus impetiginosus]
MNRKGKNNKSLCEKSMEVVINFVKLSSFSIAKMSLRPSSPQSPSTVEKHKDSRSFHANFSDSLRSVSSLSSNLKLQKSQRSSKAISYLLEPFGEGNTNSSTFVVNEEESIDGKASEYIRKVHEKNRHNSQETSNIDAYVMPPPPHLRM